MLFVVYGSDFDTCAIALLEPEELVTLDGFLNVDTRLQQPAPLKDPANERFRTRRHPHRPHHPKSSDRVAHLARTVTEEIPELDLMKQTFNTSAVLGEMRAGTALTDVALAIAYASHFGKNVLVAGTSAETKPTTTVVLPPAVVSPIKQDEPWFRAQSGNYTYLP